MLSSALVLKKKKTTETHQQQKKRTVETEKLFSLPACLNRLLAGLTENVGLLNNLSINAPENERGIAPTSGIFWQSEKEI